MNNTNFLLFKKDTDAIATNRGFYYQYLITLNLWVSNFINKEENEIYCETEDDIFELNLSSGIASFSQIKCYSEGFSQKSPEIVKSLFNFFLLYLKYRNTYNGLFYFETNAGTKPQAGKFLKEWQKNQEDSNYVINHCAIEIRNLLTQYISKVSDEKIRKIKDLKYQKKVKNAELELTKELTSSNFYDYVTRIRWNFMEKDTKEAIHEKVDTIKNLINYIPCKISKNLIFARLLSEIYRRSSEQEVKNRMLSKDILSEILYESETELTQKINKDIDVLLENDFRIMDQLDMLKNQVEKTYDLINQQFESKFSFNDFLQTYKSNVIKDLSRINFIGLHIPQGIGQNQNINLENIYVKPNFQLYKNLPKRKIHHYEDYEVVYSNKEIPYSKLFNSGKNIVVLGNPGSGKSVLVKSIICTILKNETKLIENQEIFLRIPFRIELRKYLAYKKEQKRGNIIKYLKMVLEDNYYIKNIKLEQIHAILDNYPTIVFFDGLDEIFDTINKNDVKEDIELFSYTFKNSLTVITSRVVGYNEAKLNDDFEEYFILDFDYEQLNQYLNKWYSFYLPGLENKQYREEEIKQFLDQIKQVDIELINNPLLLSLIVIIFSNLKQIPKSKLSIYESCTNTLVSKWDNIKKLKIDINLDLLKYKESIFADLAFWEYERLSSANKIDIKHEDVINKLCNTIIKKLELADNYSLAKNYANDFITYAEKRSLYFDNEFTHKTFREYFTAYWIYINLDRQYKIDERDSIITKYISNPFWSIVIELLINMIDRDQGNNETINNLIIKQINNINALTFVIDLLPKIKYISKSVIKEIILNAIDKLLKKQINPNKQKGGTEVAIFESLQKLLYTNDFDDILSECYEEIYLDIQNNINLKVKYFILYYELHDHLHINKEQRNFLKISTIIYIDDVIKTNINLFFLHFYKTRQKLDMDLMDSMVTLFGISALQKPINHYYARISYGVLSRFYFYKLIDLNSILEFESKINFLRLNGFNILDFTKKQIRSKSRLSNIINLIVTTDVEAKVALISLLIYDDEYDYDKIKLPQKNDMEILLDNNQDKDFIIELLYKKETYKNKMDLLYDHFKLKNI